MAKILVTGGAGFIGSNLVARLLADGNDVDVIDNLHTGTAANLPPASGRLHFDMWDVKSSGALANRPRYDKIFHLGIYSASPMYRKNPWLCGEVVSGMVSVLEFARKSGTPLVFASSSSLYNGHPIPSQEHLVPMVKDFYIEARYACERLAELYCGLFDTDVAALRFFSVYGPNEAGKGDYANLITQFIRGYRKGIPPTIYEDGMQSRDFVHVDDVVDAMILASQKNSGFGAYNVGTGITTSLNDIIALIKKPFDPDPIYVPCPLDYVMLDQTQADIRKSSTELGFSAKIPVQEGIRRMLALPVV